MLIGLPRIMHALLNQWEDKICFGCQALCLRGPEPWKPRSALLEHFFRSAVLAAPECGWLPIGCLSLFWWCIVLNVHFLWWSSGRGWATQP